MAAIDQLLLAFPPDNHDQLTDTQYDEAVKTFLEQLSARLSEEPSLIISAAPHLKELLDPSVNSISVLLLLNRAKNAAKPPIPRPELTKILTRFLQTFDGRQIRYVGDLYTDLIQELVDGKWVPKPQAVGLLASAILRIDPNSEMLTSNHLSLVALAQQSGQYEAALPVIEKPYVFVPNMVDPADSILGGKMASPATYLSSRSCLSRNLTRDAIMQYDESCGFILGRLRRWSEAHTAFGRIVGFPSRDTSITSAMANAYKKWILTGLLALGRMPKLPSFAHSGSTKQFHAAAKHYEDVANVFTDDDVSKLKAEVDKHAKVWEEDDNIAWINEVLAGYQKWQIVGLGKIYAKMSIREVRALTTSAETGQQLPTDQDVEALVQEMIGSGLLHGSLSTQDGTTCLSFFPEGGELSEVDFAARIKEGVSRLSALGQVAKATDTRLMTTKDYVKHANREQRRADKDISALDAGFGFDQTVEDEDLMVDVSHD